MFGLLLRIVVLLLFVLRLVFLGLVFIGVLDFVFDFLPARHCCALVLEIGGLEDICPWPARFFLFQANHGAIIFGQVVVVFLG